MSARARQHCRRRANCGKTGSGYACVLTPATTLESRRGRERRDGVKRRRRARSLELPGESTKPGRQKQQLVDLMGRDASRLRLRGSKHLVDQAIKPYCLGRRARHRGLGSNPAAANEVNSIVSVVTGNGVGERQRFDRESKARELPPERLQTLELVAKHCGALVLEPVARCLHLAAQLLDRPVVDAIEKGASQRDAFVVLRHRAAANTWAEAFLDFEPYAPRRARKNLEQLGLVGEIHPLLRGAIAQTEHVVELANRLAHA